MGNKYGMHARGKVVMLTQSPNRVQPGQMWANFMWMLERIYTDRRMVQKFLSIPGRVTPVAGTKELSFRSYMRAWITWRSRAQFDKTDDWEPMVAKFHRSLRDER